MKIFEDTDYFFEYFFMKPLNPKSGFQVCYSELNSLQNSNKFTVWKSGLDSFITVGSDQILEKTETSNENWYF